MYAVVSTGGKQYRVEAGSELIVERVGGDAGSTITFDRVLLVGDGETVTVGTPVVAGATVSGTVLGEALGPKLIVFKFKQKATYRRKNGHRQHLTRVRIDEISAGGKTSRPAAKADATGAAEAAKSEAEAAKSEAEAEKAEPKAESTEKKPARRAAAKPKATKADAAEATDAAAEKPKRTRKPAAKKTEAEE